MKHNDSAVKSSKSGTPVGTVFLFIFIFLNFFISCKRHKPSAEDDLRFFIRDNWKNTIRSVENDTGNLIGLPKPYTVPSISGIFQEMYYWDTYFTNVGLIIDGYMVQAKNNVDDILFMVNKYGYMPNGNRIFYLDRSQPPYLSMMIRDIFEHTKDKEWLRSSLPILEKEYDFWMSQRMTPCGLNRYSNQATDDHKIENFNDIGQRLGDKFDPSIAKSVDDKITIGSHFYAEYESGWDLSPRFESRCEDFCPLDLNCYLYMYEQNFAFFYKELGIDGNSKWLDLAAKRKYLINKYMFNPNDSLFYDYDYVNNKLSTVLAASVMTVLWSGLANVEQGEEIKKGLSRLEFEFGIAACESGERQYSYQWDYPNGWPCVQYLTISGLLKYGYKDDAERIAKKYVKVVNSNYEKTKNIWEKYNVTDGSLKVTNEYEMPTMMGWTAGVFVFASDFLNK